MKKLALFTAILSSCYLSGQTKLDQIEKNIFCKGVVISNKIGEENIVNTFPIYNKITSHSIIKHQKPIALSATRLQKKQDYYNYHFFDSLFFNAIEFNDEVDFTLANFKRNLVFFQSNFRKNAFFTWTVFDQNATFSRVNFYQNADFSRANFQGFNDFFQANFNHIADFYGVSFFKATNFINANFKGQTDFSFTEFHEDVTFKNAEFRNKVHLNNSVINAKMDFTGAEFDSLLDLSGSKINGSILFYNTTLPTLLDLSNITSIGSTIDLTEVQSNTKTKYCKINLINSDISKMKFRYDNFRLWFPPNTSFEVRSNVYESLLSNFQANGFTQSYSVLDIEYQKFKYLSKNEYIRNYMQNIWWNYGYNKEKIFSWILTFTIILTLLNTLFLRKLMGDIYEMNFLNYEKVKEKTELYHPIISFFLNIPVGFLYTVILLIGGAFGLRFNSGQIKFPNFIGLIYIITIGLLGISCSAFILNFIFEL